MTDHNPATAFGMVPRDQAVTISGLDFLRGMQDGIYPAPPFSEVADIWPISVEVGRIVFEGAPSARFYNPLGTVHGGWIALVLDTVMGCAIHSALKPGQGFTTTDMSTTFLRAVTEKTGKVRAEGTMLYLGGRIASAEGKLFDATGRLLAHGSETCAILDMSAAR
ncbi:MAG TPA: PaaI family thioesterase [Aliidongia sp.]|uniref:PaaI family thioesterase n=1 Tax=Aliidongia sp. TaxID=1914230 RepID=UPI002DDD038E|nr:PaaI family thioesterase [Aliidongia sp.]HEV2674283.1 PaaI family thioesterase [Aliidongia sp.]